MALKKPQLFDSTTRLADPRMFPTSVQAMKFASGTGTLPKGCAVGVVASTGLWAAWVHDAATGEQIIRGFLFEELVLDSDEEQLADVMVAGDIHYDDIEFITGSIQSDLATTVATQSPGLRELNLHVKGFPAAAVGGVDAT